MLKFSELKETANGVWGTLFELTAFVCLVVCQFVKDVIDHDWRKEWRETVLSPQNRDAVAGIFLFFTLAFQVVFYATVLPFVMCYVAAENGVVLISGRKKIPAPVQ